MRIDHGPCESEPRVPPHLPRRGAPREFHEGRGRDKAHAVGRVAPDEGPRGEHECRTVREVRPGGPPHDRRQKLLVQAQDVRQAIDEIQHGGTGELRIGATVTAANYLLPEALAAYRHAFPRVRVSLHPSSTGKLLNQIRRNELDVATVGHVPEAGDLHVWGEIRDEIVWVAAPGHPLARGRKQSADRLGEHDVILRESTSDTRVLAEAWARSAGVSLRLLMDMW